MRLEDILPYSLELPYGFSLETGMHGKILSVNLVRDERTATTGASRTSTTRGNAQMDPNECLRLFLQALEEQDDEAAIEHAESLLHWMDRGGFMPGSFSDPEYRRVVMGALHLADNLGRAKSEADRWAKRVLTLEDRRQKATLALAGKL